jgi:hypothetical protein
VTPSGLSGAAPGSPTISGSTSANVAFQSIAYYGGSGVNESALDEIISATRSRR